MKKIFYCTLSVAFLAASVASCAKSSKGKMANEWKVTSLEQTNTDTQSNGDETVDKTSMTETSATMTTTETSGGTSTTTTQTATVNANNMTIEKDGTWKWDQEWTSTQDVFGQTMTINNKMMQSGTWSFIGTNKDEDFKKNERVIFNVLSETNTTTQTIGGSTSTSTSSDTYMTGENTMLFTVEESKSKSLELEAETASTNTSGGSTSSSKGTLNIKLEEK